MNLQNIFNDLQAADPEFAERISPRRSVIKNMGRIASMAALPIAFGSLLNKAYGKTNAILDETLNFALTLEYLEWEFYKQAVSSGVVPSGAPLGALTTIRDHERDHVTFLRTAIQGLSATPVSFTAANFDFTAGGTFPTVFSNYGVLLAVSQAFEDTGVRAYKGQAGNLVSSNEVLTAALQIHSVEARHASHIRQMRRALADPTVVGTTKPWITGNQSNIGSAAVQGIYNGEEVTTQATVSIATGGISVAAASEAFDEPLTKAEVLAIVDPFIL